MGHTNEDIDAVFAKIWECFSYQPCETLQKYKEMIEDHFEKAALRANVDVMIIPDFVRMFESQNCIDSKFAKLHRKNQTQLQWLFQAVTPDRHFPFGCKATFRAYSSDLVVEFIIKPKLECTSTMGRVVGLEPMSTSIRLFPSTTCDF